MTSLQRQLTEKMHESPFCIDVFFESTAQITMAYEACALYAKSKVDSVYGFTSAEGSVITQTENKMLNTGSIYNLLKKLEMLNHCEPNRLFQKTKPWSIEQHT